MACFLGKNVKGCEGVRCGCGNYEGGGGCRFDSGFVVTRHGVCFGGGRGVAWDSWRLCGWQRRVRL